jgi:Carboxypeptidase regulatory-like domain/TonB dependent receptor
VISQFSIGSHGNTLTRPNASTYSPWRRQLSNHRKVLCLITTAVFAICLMVGILAAPPCLRAQGSSGRITGTVSDPSDARIPDAAVVITNVDTDAIRTMKTDSQGIYVAPDLNPGHYKIEVTSAGFGSEVRSGLTLLIGQTLTLNIFLKPGTAAENVTVTSSAQLIDTTTSAQGDFVTEKSVSDLPLNGRDFNSLIGLVAGATPGNNGLYDINGGRGEGNSYLVDGVDVVSAQTVYGPPPNKPNLEAIGEFQVMTSNFSAEYGRSVGGVINTHIKSGGNAIHGSLFEYFRNDALDANNRFATTNPPYRFNQFGGSLGGAIIKDKLFYFGDYQGNRIVQASPVSVGVPSPAWRTPSNGYYDFGSLCTEGFDATGICGGNPQSAHQIYDPFNPIYGIFRQPFPFNRIPASLADPTTALAMSLFPNPNTTGNAYNTNAKTNIVQNSGDGRFDYDPTNQDRISFTVIYSDYSGITPSIFGSGMGFTGGPPYNLNSEQVYNLSYQHIFGSTKVNEFNWGISMDHQNAPNSEGTQYESSLAGLGGLNTDAKGLQTNGLPYLLNVDTNSTFGSPQGVPYVLHSNTPQFGDNFSWTAGRHALKVGFQMRFREYNALQSNAPRGQYAFAFYETALPVYNSTFTGLAGLYGGNGWASTLLGDYIYNSRGILTQEFGQRSKEFGTFIQDDFKVTPRLTLNLGLRWDLYTPYTEVNNRLANFDLASKKMVIADQNGASASTVDADYRDFQPRVGFAYALTNDGKTSVRGGYGLAFLPMTNAAVGTVTDRLTVNTPFSFNSTNTFFQNVTFPPAALVSNGIPVVFPSDPTQVPAGGSVVYIPKSHPTPYNQQWSLSIQRELPWNVIFATAYIGAKGTHLTGSRNLNQWPAGPNESIANAPISPNLGAVTGLISDEFSNYNALQVKANKTATSDLSFQASYTFSRSIDNGSSTQLGASAGNPEPQYAYDLAAERGPSDFNVTQRFTTSVIYVLPFGAGLKHNISNSALDAVAGGWQMNSLVAAQSGTPFTPLATSIVNSGPGGPLRPNPNPGVDRYGTTCLPQIAGSNAVNWFNPCAFVNPVNSFGTVGRNSLIGPSFFNIDFSLFKTFRITERFRLQFRSEFFNVLNHQNLGQPNASILNASGNAQAGQINTISGNPRQIQLALKLIF